MPFEPLLESLHLRKCMLHKSIWIELTKYFSFFQTHDVGFERLIKIIFGKHGGAVVVFSKPMVMVPSLFLIDKVPISSRNQFTSSSLRAASPSSSGSLATWNIRWPLQEQEWSKNLAHTVGWKGISKNSKCQHSDPYQVIFGFIPDIWKWVSPKSDTWLIKNYHVLKIYFTLFHGLVRMGNPKIFFLGLYHFLTLVHHENPWKMGNFQKMIIFD